MMQDMVFSKIQELLQNVTIETLHDVVRNILEILALEWERIETEKQTLKFAMNEVMVKTKELESIIGKEKKKFTKHKIKLNVGGSIFATSLSTLTSVPNTLFTDMFAGPTEPQPDQDGEFFIDRNPKYFEMVLDLLRKGNLILDDLSRKELDELVMELKYYKLEKLAESIRNSEVYQTKMQDITFKYRIEITVT